MKKVCGDIPCLFASPRVFKRGCRRLHRFIRYVPLRSHLRSDRGRCAGVSLLMPWEGVEQWRLYIGMQRFPAFFVAAGGLKAIAEAATKRRLRRVSLFYLIYIATL